MTRNKNDRNDKRNDIVENKTNNFTADHVFKIQSDTPFKYSDQANYTYTSEISNEWDRQPVGLIIEKEQG